MGPPGLPSPPPGGGGYPLRRNPRIFKKIIMVGGARLSQNSFPPSAPSCPPCPASILFLCVAATACWLAWAGPRPPLRNVVRGAWCVPAQPHPLGLPHLLSKERQFNNPSDRNMRESREEVFAAPRGREELCLLEPLCNYQFCRFSNIPISYLYLCLLQRLFCFQPGTPSVGRGFSQHSLSNQPEISTPSELNSGPWWDETHPHVWCAPDCADRMLEVGSNSLSGDEASPAFAGLWSSPLRVQRH